MRDLSETLKLAQQAGAKNALVKLVLTLNSATYTYTKTRILHIEETGDGSLQSIELLLHNRDGVLTALDLKGYQGVLSFGAVASAGEEEYSACAPTWVMAQEFDSDPNKLNCTLTLVGICNLMSTDEASEAYQPDVDDTKTVKTLVNQIAGASLDCFGHCKAYEVVWDDGYDTLADTYTPKDEFRIYTGNNRNSAIDRLLDFTLNVKIVKADGKIHIFKPTTSGETYDCEYSLESGHPFFAKALRNRLVTPNYIKVQSRDDDDPSYSGTAQDPSYATLPGELKKHHYKQTYLESDEQATLIAEAILAKFQMWCEAGAANVPLNVGQEVFDYVKVTDSREGDYRVGNIGRYVRHYDVRKNEWGMTFVFGNWQNVRKVLANLNITGDDIENYFSRLRVKNLYVEHIFAYLDEILDGPDIYIRQKSLHLDATGVYLAENTLYSIRLPGEADRSITKSATAPPSPEDGDFWVDTNYIPNMIKMWDGDSWEELTSELIALWDRAVIFRRLKTASLTADGLVVLDEVQEGTYGLVKYTDISAGHILLSKTVKDGLWYEESGVAIDATIGIGIYGGVGLSGLRTYPTAADYANDTNVQCYVGTDGKFYAGGGKVYLDELGLYLKGQYFFIQDTNGVTRGHLFGADNYVQLQANNDLNLWALGDIVIDTHSLQPVVTDFVSLGTASKQFYGGYFGSRLKIPVGTDMYD